MSIRLSLLLLLVNPGSGSEGGWTERWGQAPWGPETHDKELKFILEPKEAEEGFEGRPVFEKLTLACSGVGNAFPRVRVEADR